MKYEIKAWDDTKNVDLKLIPETAEDKALCVLLGDRKPRWYEGTDGEGIIELVFEPPATPERIEDPNAERPHVQS